MKEQRGVTFLTHFELALPELLVLCQDAAKP